MTKCTRKLHAQANGNKNVLFAHNSQIEILISTRLQLAKKTWIELLVIYLLKAKEISLSLVFVLFVFCVWRLLAYIFFAFQYRFVSIREKKTQSEKRKLKKAFFLLEEIVDFILIRMIHNSISSTIHIKKTGSQLHFNVACKISM